MLPTKTRYVLKVYVWIVSVVEEGWNNYLYTAMIKELLHHFDFNEN